MTHTHAVTFYAAGTQPIVQYLEQSGPPQPTELYYDSIFIKFDPECTSHGNVNLKEHFASALKEALVAPVKSKAPAAFASVSDNEAPLLKDDHLPDAQKFTALLDANLLKAASLFTVSAEESSDAIDAQIAAAGPASLRRLEYTSARRKLAELPQLQREAEIMGSLHLLAASHLVGEEHAVELIELETSGNSTSLVEFIDKHKKLALQQESLTRLRERMGASASKNSAGRSFQSVSEGANSEGKPVITETELLSSLGIRVIKNPLLEADLLRLANLLPCIAFEAEPDRSKTALGQIGAVDLTATPRFLEPTLTRATLPVLVNDSSELVASGGQREYSFLAPDDAHFQSQWYLK